MNKKAQINYPIITFIVIGIMLIIFAPVMLKIFNEILTPFSAKVGNITAVAGTNVDAVRVSFVAFWDWIIIIAFLIQVILLFVSAFYIDTSPVFVPLYILVCILMMIFAPDMIQIVDRIYDSPQFLLETTQLPFTDFIRTHFATIILGIMVLSGVVIYGKLKYFRGGMQY